MHLCSADNGLPSSCLSSDRLIEPAWTSAIASPRSAADGGEEVDLAVFLYLLQDSQVGGLPVYHHRQVGRYAVLVTQKVYDARIRLFQALNHLPHCSTGSMYLSLAAGQTL